MIQPIITFASATTARAASVILVSIPSAIDSEDNPHDRTISRAT